MTTVNNIDEIGDAIEPSVGAVTPVAPIPSAVEMVGNELRNVVAYWRARFEADLVRFPVPSFVTWTFPQGPIVEGQMLGMFVWPDATETPFFAPPGCHGAVIDMADQFETELFHREPAQWLLRLHQ